MVTYLVPGPDQQRRESCDRLIRSFGPDPAVEASYGWHGLADLLGGAVATSLWRTAGGEGFKYRQWRPVGTLAMTSSPLGGIDFVEGLRGGEVISTGEGGQGVFTRSQPARRSVQRR